MTEDGAGDADATIELPTFAVVESSASLDPITSATCFCGKPAIKGEWLVLGCAVCGRLCHGECAGVTAELAPMLGDLEYSCSICRGNTAEQARAEALASRAMLKLPVPPAPAASRKSKGVVAKHVVQASSRRAGKSTEATEVTHEVVAMPMDEDEADVEVEELDDSIKVAAHEVDTDDDDGPAGRTGARRRGRVWTHDRMVLFEAAIGTLGLHATPSSILAHMAELEREARLHSEAGISSGGGDGGGGAGSSSRDPFGDTAEVGWGLELGSKGDQPPVVEGLTKAQVKGKLSALRRVEKHGEGGGGGGTAAAGGAAPQPGYTATMSIKELRMALGSRGLSYEPSDDHETLATLLEQSVGQAAATKSGAASSDAKIDAAVRKVVSMLVDQVERAELVRGAAKKKLARQHSRSMTEEVMAVLEGLIGRVVQLNTLCATVLPYIPGHLWGGPEPILAELDPSPPPMGGAPSGAVGMPTPQRAEWNRVVATGLAGLAAAPRPFDGAGPMVGSVGGFMRTGNSPDAAKSLILMAASHTAQRSISAAVGAALAAPPQPSLLPLSVEGDAAGAMGGEPRKRGRRVGTKAARYTPEEDAELLQQVAKFRPRGKEAWDLLATRHWGGTRNGGSLKQHWEILVGKRPPSATVMKRMRLEQEAAGASLEEEDEDAVDADGLD